MTRRFGLFALLSSLLLWGCPGDDDPQTLTIATPDADGITLTIADDQDTASDGIQYTYIVRGQGLEGVQVTLQPEAGATGVTIAPATQTFGSDGEVSFAVNFSADGEFTLTATANDLTASRTVNVQTACAVTNFVNPAGMGTVNLGESDDLNNDCDDGFAINVQVSTDAGAGASAMLLVNGSPAGTADIEGTLLNFSDVTLGNRDTANTLSVVVTRGDGVACPAVDFPGNVFVDCAGPGCSLRAPDLSAGTLGNDDDSSAEPGFQATFEVATDAEAAGAVQQLVVDGLPITATAAAAGMGAEAIFGNVDLSEGPHSVRPICADLAGNMTPGTVSEFRVDTTPCSVIISAPAANALFIDEDDLDTDTAGIQVDVTGTISGDNCAGVELAVGAGAGEAATVTGNDFSGRITLPNTTGSYDITATVADDVNNTSDATISVRVAADGSPLAISSPAAPTSYNVNGTGMAMADLDTDTTDCEAQIVVDCGSVGAMVELVRQDSDTVLGSAMCEASGTVMAPFTGQATFEEVGLPTDNAGGDYNVVARTTVDRIETTSAPLAVTPDCHAPALSIFAPACGSVLRPMTDDSSADPGFQFTVRALNSAVPAQNASLRIFNMMGDVSSMNDVVPVGASYIFSNANFGSGGELSLEVCSTDGAGNQGCSDACSVRVVDLPAVSISSPTGGSIVTEDSAGCAAGEVQFTGTTDAEAGATAEVVIGMASTSATISGTAVSACVPVSEGAVNAELRVTDGRGTGSAMVSFTVDRLAPTSSITDLMMTLEDRRDGDVRFTWTAITDDTGALLSSYELRCSQDAISTPARWDAATVIPQTVMPGAAGTAEAVTIAGFGIGRTHHCAIRGRDAGGRLSPQVATSPSVTINFQSMTLDIVDGVPNIAPVGDVNNDMIPDFVVTDGGTFVATGNGAELWLGGATPVRVALPGTTRGLSVASIGDVNGDSFGDFVVASPFDEAFNGRLDIFFGRSTADWGTDAGPSRNIVGVGANSAVGLGVAGLGDVDGGGRPDFAFSNFGNRSVLVVRGEWLAGTGAGAVAYGDIQGFELLGPILPTQTRPLTPHANGFGGLAGGNLLAGLGGSTGDAAFDLIIGGRDAAGTGTEVYGVALPAWTSGLVSVPATGLSLIDAVGGNPGMAAEAVVAIGDVNGDGRGDFAVDHRQGGTAGRLRIYRSSADGTFAVAGRFELANDAPDLEFDYFASSIAMGFHPSLGNLGDIDGDGRADILAGSKQFATGNGGAELFFDPVNDNRRSDAFRAAFTTAMAMATTTSNRVAFVGDIDNDGHNDLAFTDPGAGELIILH